MKRLTYLFLIATLMLCLTACSKDDDATETPTEPVTPTKTILMYFPWASNLSRTVAQGGLGCFWTNIAAMKQAYTKYGKGSENVIVFICTSTTQAYMFNIKDYTGYDSKSLASYTSYENPDYLTSDGISQIITKMKAMATAPVYGMIVGSHGMGWLLKESLTTTNSAKSLYGGGISTIESNTYTDSPVTRCFGCAGYWVDIMTFADALKSSDTHFDFLLFDDCYMSSIEAAYDLRGVADYLIACPTEVMSYGMPYNLIGEHLLGETDYEGVCNDFFDFYSSTSSPYGTIAVTDLSELDSLARIEKKINALYTFDTSLKSSLQKMDGRNTSGVCNIFYDYGDYVAKLCPDTVLLAEFNQQLDKTVPYYTYTNYFPYAVGDYVYTYPITTYSGLTTSAPSTRGWAAGWEDTSWYKATH